MYAEGRREGGRIVYSSVPLPDVLVGVCLHILPLGSLIRCSDRRQLNPASDTTLTVSYSSSRRYLTCEISSVPLIGTKSFGEYQEMALDAGFHSTIDLLFIHPLFSTTINPSLCYNTSKRAAMKRRLPN